MLELLRKRWKQELYTYTDVYRPTYCICILSEYILMLLLSSIFIFIADLYILSIVSRAAY
jgi:hypothetical protein